MIRVCIALVIVTTLQLAVVQVLLHALPEDPHRPVDYQARKNDPLRLSICSMRLLSCFMGILGGTVSGGYAGIHFAQNNDLLLGLIGSLFIGLPFGLIYGAIFDLVSKILALLMAIISGTLTCLLIGIYSWLFGILGGTLVGILVGSYFEHRHSNEYSSRWKEHKARVEQEEAAAEAAKPKPRPPIHPELKKAIAYNALEAAQKLHEERQEEKVSANAQKHLLQRALVQADDEAIQTHTEALKEHLRAVEPPPPPPSTLALTDREEPPPPPEIQPHEVKPLAPSLVCLRKAVKKEMALLAIEEGYESHGYEGHTTKSSMIPTGFRLDSPRSQTTDSEFRPDSVHSEERNLAQLAPEGGRQKPYHTDSFDRWDRGLPGAANGTSPKPRHSVSLGVPKRNLARSPVQGKSAPGRPPLVSLRPQPSASMPPSTLNNNLSQTVPAKMKLPTAGLAVSAFMIPASRQQGQTKEAAAPETFSKTM